MSRGKGPYPAVCGQCGRAFTVSAASWLRARRPSDRLCLACTRVKNGWTHTADCPQSDDDAHRGPCSSLEVAR